MGIIFSKMIQSVLKPKLLCCEFYSARRLFTGFARAALSDWYNTVSKAIMLINTSGRRKNHHPMLM
jgi:hypothetical protein